MNSNSLPGLLTALGLSLSVALAANAQMSPTTQNEQMNPSSTQTQPQNSSQMQTQTQTTTSSYQSFQSTSSTALATPQSIENQSLYTAGEVVVGADASSTIMPRLIIGQNTATSITVLNPTPKPVMFSSPTLNVSYEVPANAERTIQIDRAQTANLTPGQEVAYYINDSQGNVIASSSFVNNQSIATMVDTNTQVATTEETTTTSTATTQQPAPTRRSTVRGYW
ncbi:MAG: hypothetical protein K0Q50_443 [Vampirovibrio sp.]|jgi:hypothetical protein|nr:hypothetical protein [Vampirovibrio sp.]